MATRRKDITHLFISDHEEVFWEPADVKFPTAPWKQMILIFEDGSARTGGHAEFDVPKDYVGSPAIVVKWAADTATSGDIEVDVDYRNVALGESVNQAGTQEAVNDKDTAPGTVALLQELVLPLTAANFAVDDLCECSLFRDKSDIGDTMADEACFFKVFFQYSDA